MKGANTMPRLAFRPQALPAAWLSALALAISIAIAQQAIAAEPRPINLRCEYLVNPLGLDVPAPRLSWQLDDPRRGAVQTAYRILVAGSAELLASDKGDLWDSGEVASDRTTWIPYAGKALAAHQMCHWKVRVWDKDRKPSAWSDPAFWSVGFLAPDDWGGAKWLAATEKAAAPAPKSAKQAGEGHGYHGAVAKGPDETKWVQVDLGASRAIEAVELHPCDHVGVKGFGFPVRFRIEASDDADFKAAAAIADHTKADAPNPGAAVRRFAAPAGAKGRYVRVTVTKLYSYKNQFLAALARMAVLSGGKNIASGAPVAALDSIEDFGWSKASLTALPGAPPPALAAAPNATAAPPADKKIVNLPIFRKEFTVAKPARRAVASICGLGQYELFLNGAKVGDHVMDPPWTNYRKRCTYAAYDVTAQIRPGANALGVMLGNGMYNVTGGRYTKFKGSMGPPKFILHLRVEHADGSHATVISDASWRMDDGPITFSCIYGGEDYDARLDQPGWTKPGFDAARWIPALEVAGPGGRLAGPVAPPVKVVQTFSNLKGVEGKDGVVFDSGQNGSMRVKLAVRGPAGSAVRVLMSEGGAGGGGAGSYFAYTLRGGGVETWQPQFFYHGFRSVKVAGATLDAGATDKPVVQALEIQHVRNAAPLTADFACSNDLVNRIRHIILWSMHSNFQHVLTDCPHREKLGWLEVSHLMAPSLMYEYDAAGFFAKILDDMAEAQLANGMVPDIAPEYVVFSGGFRDSPEWGSAYLLNPGFVHRWYGDAGPTREHYEGMKRYLAYLASRAKDHILSHGLGDWMPQDKSPLPLVATATYYQDLIAMAEAARRLGKEDEAKGFSATAEQVRQAFNKSFFNAETKQYGTGSQTSNAMPLTLGLVEPAHRAAVLEHLVQEVLKRRHTLTAGDVGNRYVIQALARNGRSDLLYEMAVQTQSPGYGSQVKQGKTTLTEAWNGGASQNHCMLGHIEEWFFHDLLGIQPDPAAPGFQQIVVAPQVVGDLTWAKGHYDSIRGRIAVSWKRDGGALALDVTIPANAAATVSVPAGDPAGVTEGGKPAGESPGVKFLRREEGRAIYAVGAGRYAFTSTLKTAPGR
jgi:alpha-L-rhamnosidase